MLAALMRVLFFLFALNLVFAQRPPLNQRRFSSNVINQFVQQTTMKIDDPVIAKMFEQTFPNTLDTTVYVNGIRNETVVITGDIEAMWFRDSTNQVIPYLSFVNQDPGLDSMIAGLIRRQVGNVLIDPYANAFNLNHEVYSGGNQNDMTTKPSFLGTTVNAMTKLIFERKFEIDSLLAFFKLCNLYYEAKGAQGLNVFRDSSLNFAQAIENVLDVFAERQKKYQDPPAYFFLRETTVPTDSLVKGVGSPFRETGMLSTPFRPSDDATTFAFHIPGNAMAVVELKKMSVLLQALNETLLSTRAASMSGEIDNAIKEYGLTKKSNDTVYCYEVDGFGNCLFMDDANVPSLLSLPYLGYLDITDPIYQNTRRWLLNSTSNPYYFASNFTGIGSPHTPYGNIWPMSLIMQALTTNDDQEISDVLLQLKTR